MDKKSDRRINAKDLLELGYPSRGLIELALNINKRRHGFNRADMLKAFAGVLANPDDYLHHPVFSALAHAVVNSKDTLSEKGEIERIVAPRAHYRIFGAEMIEEGAHQQMQVAMQLPISAYGALLPDAHQGYGLPIGGVLAAKNAVIPYGVGVDIGCRMAMSIYDITVGEFESKRDFFKRLLLENTLFGAGNGFDRAKRAEHDVLDRREFRQSPFLRQLHDKAWTQLGSSGGGNHFVEWGIIEVDKREHNIDALPNGTFLALLSHSGSRGLGATIAGHYTKIAMEICKLPKPARHLAYFDLDSAEGQAYWQAMTLAGDYAEACHQVIHKKISAMLGSEPIFQVSNHHNFAWRENIAGENYIVHRKGATPAHTNALGIVPGSMTSPAFVVVGKGNMESLQSASHGAGRQMSRTQAAKLIAQEEINRTLQLAGVELIGGGRDEAPQAYKDIHRVMQSQRDLVDIVGRFQPKIVRMADDGSRED